MAASSAAEQLFGDLRGGAAPSVDRRPETGVSNDLSAMADAAAQRHGIDPRFFRGVIQTESSWNPGALGPITKSGERAVGLGQVMPSTAAGEGYNPADLADPEVNLDASAKYLSKMLVQARGDHNLAARMYNAGPAGNLDHPDVAAYADKVFTNARRYDDTGPTPDLFRGFSTGLNSALNDSTTGLSGYSSAAQGFNDDAAASYAAYRDRQRELDDQARPQDQSFTEAVRGGAGEFFGDYLPYTIGNALGSSAPSLGAAAAGAGTGFMMAGPPGAAVGAIAGGAIPLLTQYFGSTWGENTSEKLAQKGINPDQASLSQIQAASGMDTAEFARVTSAAIGRAGLEGAGEMFLGGFGGKLISKAEKLLPKGAAKGATDLLSNSAGGRIAAAALGEGATEMGDVPLSDIGSGRAANGKWSGAQEYLDAAAGGVFGGGGARAGYEAGRNPSAAIGAVQSGISNTVGKTQWGQERYRNKMGSTIDSVVQGQVDAQNEKDTADAQAEAERNRIPSAKELHQQMLAEHEAKLKGAKLPAPTEEEFYAETEKYENPEDLPPHLATFAAYKTYRRKTDKAEQAKRNLEVGPLPTMQDALKRRQEMIRDTSPKKTYVNKATGQMDMWGNEYGKGEVVPPEQEPAAENVGPDIRQGEIDFGPEPLALTDESASTALAKAKAATSPEEKRAWLNVAVKRYVAQQPASSNGQLQNTPTLADFQDVIDSLNTEQGQVASAQRAADTREAERTSLAGERNQAYDDLESQQAAEKEAQFADMERQRLEQDAKQQIAEGNRVSGDQALINKKTPSSFKTRPSEETAENLAAIEAQNKTATKHNTLLQKLEEAKQQMLTKAIDALRKQGAQIEDGDQLQWKDRAWSLFPPNFRGRPPTGNFYADVFNTAGDKIGKVLRPNRPTPPTPPEETGNEDTTSSDSSNGNKKEKSKPRRKSSRRVSVSEAQGQSEANDAAQGSEVTGDPEAEVAAELKRLEEKQTDGTLDEADVDALIKKIGDMEKKKQQRDDDIAGEEGTDNSSSLDEFSDLFNKSGRQEGANDVKKFLTQKSQADQKKNPTTVKDILQHYLDTVPKGPYRGLARILMAIPSISSVPISFMPQTDGAFGMYRTKQGAIEVGDGGGWHTVFHEAIHAATVKGYATDKALKVAIDNLYTRVKAQAERDGKLEQYGLTSALEFMAEAMTNPEFQAYLDSIDFSKNQSMWGRFVEVVNNFIRKFGVGDENIETALEAAMGLTKIAMQRTKEAGDIRLNDAEKELVLAHTDFKEFTDKVLDTSFGELIGKGADTFNNLIIGVNNTAFLAKWFPNMESLQTIHASETKMQASQGKNANATMDKVDDIRNLQKQDRVKLFNLMVDSTRERMHPDQAFDDKTNAHIPATPENEATHRKLKGQFNALSPDARKAYQETRDLFQTMFDQRTKALFALADRILTEKKREQFKENVNRLVKGMPGPYFPLTRFGNYVAVWKSKDYAKAQKDHDTKAMEKLKADPNHYSVSFHGSSFQAKQALKKMVAKMGDRSALGENESYAREREFYDGGVTMDLQPLLEKMQDAVETTLGKENAKEAKDALAEIFVSSLADTNVLKSTLKRENIEGVKPAEMLQAIARHGSAQAFHISRLEHMADIQDALKKLRNEDSVEVNKGQRFSLYNTVAKALTGMYTGDPTSFPVRAINATNFLLYNGRLALNPAFWLTNAMAPLVVSVPYMRGRFKLNTVMEAYREAAIDAGKVVMPKGLKDATRFSLLDAITNAKGLKQGERDMLLELMDEGLIDENQIRELSNVAQGNIGVRDDIARYLGAIPHRVEALNRVSTALAAYRLELAKTKDQAAATRYAIETTSETQVNYTTAGTPYILRKNGWLGSPAAKILTQFMRYQLGMVQLIGHNFREAWVSKSVDAKTREEARRKFFALLSMHTAMTGASGWFGASAFMALAQMGVNAFRDDDDEIDLEQEAKKLTDSIFGKELSVGVRKGLPAMAGLDLSSRLGMGDMLSIRKENPFRGDAREAKAQFVDMSPALSNLFEWYGWARNGFPMKKIPIAMIASTAKAYEMATKGMVNTHGVVKKGAEDFDKVDIALQGLGFTPTEATEAYAAQNTVREKEKAVGTARESLLDEWNNAVADNDKEAVTEARKKITEFNARHKGQRDIQITPDTLTKSRKQRLSRQKRMNDSGVYVPKGGQWRNNLTTAEE